MQSKTKIFASFILVFSLSLFVFILGSPKDVLGVVQNSQCVATSCGTSEGTKQVPVYKKVCDKGCPTRTFEAERYVCPNGYSLVNKVWCYKKNHSLKAATKETFGPIEVQYGTRSQDPNKCHRPNVTNLQVPVWAKDYYNTQLPEHLAFVDVNCRQELDGYETVACNDAPITICPTHRWCFPAIEQYSPTGYIAEAISVEITPETGKPWESGKMIDKYCGYTPAGTCPTQCDYAGGDEVPDGQGGFMICPATQACVIDEIDEEEEEGDVLGESTTAEVKGTTTVVYASTAAGDRSTIFLIQSLLLIATGFSLIYVGKEYLNRYEV